MGWGTDVIYVTLRLKHRQAGTVILQLSNPLLQWLTMFHHPGSPSDYNEEHPLLIHTGCVEWMRETKQNKKTFAVLSTWEFKVNSLLQHNLAYPDQYTTIFSPFTQYSALRKCSLNICWMDEWPNKWMRHRNNRWKSEYMIFPKSVEKDSSPRQGKKKKTGQLVCSKSEIPASLSASWKCRFFDLEAAGLWVVVMLLQVTETLSEAEDD